MPKPDEIIPTANLEEILAASVLDFPPRVGHGRKKVRGLSKRKKSEENYDQLIEYLESLRKELTTPRRRAKTRNILERSPKESVIAAVLRVATIFKQTTGYNAKWLRNAIEQHWQAGTRQIKHSYEKRIMCCQLIHFLKTQGISELQAIALTDQIYKFNKTDAKDTYYYFKRDLNKYYFPEIKIKAHIPIYIFLDAIKYGHIKMVRTGKIKENTLIKFEQIITGVIELLKKEINSIKPKLLKKQQVIINPIILRYLNREYKNPKYLIDEIKKDEALGDFTFAVRQFLNSLEYLHESNIER